MLSHEFFHEQAHIKNHHELKRGILFAFIILLLLFLYRLVCHLQEYEADRYAAERCGRVSALESLRFLQMREGKRSFFVNLFSLHPRTENRIRAL